MQQRYKGSILGGDRDIVAGQGAAYRYFLGNCKNPA